MLGGCKAGGGSQEGDRCGRQYVGSLLHLCRRPVPLLRSGHPQPSSLPDAPSCMCGRQREARPPGLRGTQGPSLSSQTAVQLEHCGSTAGALWQARVAYRRRRLCGIHGLQTGSSRCPIRFGCRVVLHDRCGICLLLHGAAGKAGCRSGGPESIRLTLIQSRIAMSDSSCRGAVAAA